MSKITYPIIGNYHLPVYFLLNNISKYEVVKPKKITNKTLELGVNSSPDYVCTPFKYTLGNYLESGADKFIQLGGGCKYGYYYELQELKLKEIDNNYEVINLITKGKTELNHLKTQLKRISDKNMFYIAHIGYLTYLKVKYMDLLEYYIRKNKVFCNKEKIDNLYTNFLNEIDTTKNHFKIRSAYKKTLKEITKLKKNKKHFKIAIIGELYTLMEPFANYNIEEYLIGKGVSIERHTNASFLLFQKKKFYKKNIGKSSYINTKMGADASENIIMCEKYCNENYDAIIHIKSSFCTPEIGAMPILSKIANEKNVPLLFLTFDSNTSKTGLITRLEALIDMIEMRKNNEETLSRN